MTRTTLMDDPDATLPVPRPLPPDPGDVAADKRLPEAAVMGLFDAVPAAGQGRRRKWLPPSTEDLQQALPQYEITSFIAHGGMGAVYKGMQRSLRRTVAIKVLPPEIEDNDMLYAERFKREAQSMAQLTHPNIVTVHDAGETAQGLLYFVMEFIEGTDLVQLITSEGRIEPQRAMPRDLPLSDLQGASVNPASLKGQWLLVVVAGGACDPVCEKMLWLQRQLREALGREKTRVDKLWLIPDDVNPAARTLQAIAVGEPASALRVPAAALTQWLQAAPNQGLGAHLYIVDPMSHWMMRSPADPDPAKLKRDLEKLLRASASWDIAGREAPSAATPSR